MATTTITMTASTTAAITNGRARRIGGTLTPERINSSARYHPAHLGGMAERTKAAVSKTVESVLPVPWVRIPLPPPDRSAAEPRGFRRGVRVLFGLERRYLGRACWVSPRTIAARFNFVGTRRVAFRRERRVLFVLDAHYLGGLLLCTSRGLGVSCVRHVWTPLAVRGGGWYAACGRGSGG